MVISVGGCYADGRQPTHIDRQPRPGWASEMHRREDPVKDPELAGGWRKSTRSGESECLQFKIVHDDVLISDSKTTGGDTLRFARIAWATFVHSIKTGELEGPTS